MKPEKTALSRSFSSCRNGDHDRNVMIETDEKLKFVF